MQNIHVYEIVCVFYGPKINKVLSSGASSTFFVTGLLIVLKFSNQMIIAGLWMPGLFLCLLPRRCDSKYIVPHLTVFFLNMVSWDRTRVSVPYMFVFHVLN